MFRYHAIHLHQYLENNNSSRRISLCVVCALSDLLISSISHASGVFGLTSHPSTSFMISFSRAMAAWLRRYASRSCSARIRGTRWILDQACSRFSSLFVSLCLKHTSSSVPSHLHPYPPKLDLRPVHPFVFHFPSTVYQGFVVHKSQDGEKATPPYPKHLPPLQIPSSQSPESKCTNTNDSSENSDSSRSSRW